MDTNESNVQGRASYTEEERRELMEEFHSSDLMQAAFCLEWNINPKTLARWLRLERDGNEISLCAVKVARTAVRLKEVRVCLPNGVEIFVPVGAPLELGGLFQEATTW
jgi:transposase-like protein